MVWPPHNYAWSQNHQYSIELSIRVRFQFSSLFAYWGLIFNHCICTCVLLLLWALWVKPGKIINKIHTINFLIIRFKNANNVFVLIYYNLLGFKNCIYVLVASEVCLCVIYDKPTEDPGIINSYIRSVYHTSAPHILEYAFLFLILNTFEIVTSLCKCISELWLR